MLQTEEDNEFNPRHRLLGAIVLVALGVIFLPMLFSGQAPRSAVQQGNSMPLQRGGLSAATQPTMPIAAQPELQTHTISIGEQKSNTTEAASGEIKDPTPAPNPVDTAAAKPAEKPTDKIAEKTTAQKTVKTASIRTAASAAPVKSSASSQGWVIQIGTFTNADNARRLGTKLRRQGFDVNLDDVLLKQGAAVRVRVGPFANENAAQKEQTRLQKQMGVKGYVVAQGSDR